MFVFFTVFTCFSTEVASCRLFTAKNSYSVHFNGDISFKENVTNWQKVGKPDNISGLELISQLRATVYLHVGNSSSYLIPLHHGYS